MKRSQLLQFQYYEDLEDHELLSVIVYCKKMIDKSDVESVEELENLSEVFFDGDIEEAIKTLMRVYKLYQDEYFGRHKN